MPRASVLLHATCILGVWIAYSLFYTQRTILNAQFVQTHDRRPGNIDCFNCSVPVVKSVRDSLEKPLNPTTISHIFQKHCNWSASRSEGLPADFTSMQNLIRESTLHCTESALPYPSVDVWYHQADVRIISGTPVEVARMDLHEKCNKKSERACIIFLVTSLIHSYTLGCSFLLEVLERPFVLITADNHDECVPFITYPASISSSEADFLIASPLLIRWYSKVREIPAKCALFPSSCIATCDCI